MHCTPPGCPMKTPVLHHKRKSSREYAPDCAEHQRIVRQYSSSPPTLRPRTRIDLSRNLHIDRRICAQRGALFYQCTPVLVASRHVAARVYHIREHRLTDRGSHRLRECRPVYTLTLFWIFTLLPMVTPGEITTPCPMLHRSSERAIRRDGREVPDLSSQCRFHKVRRQSSTDGQSTHFSMEEFLHPSHVAVRWRPSIRTGCPLISKRPLASLQHPAALARLLRRE